MCSLDSWSCMNWNGLGSKSHPAWGLNLRGLGSQMGMAARAGKREGHRGWAQAPWDSVWWPLGSVSWERPHASIPAGHLPSWICSPSVLVRKQRSRGEEGLAKVTLLLWDQEDPGLEIRCKPKRKRESQSRRIFLSSKGHSIQSHCWDLCCTLVLFWARFGNLRRKTCCVLQMCAHNKHARYVLGRLIAHASGRWQNAVMQPGMKSVLHLAAYEKFSVRIKMLSWHRCCVNGAISHNKTLLGEKCLYLRDIESNSCLFFFSPLPNPPPPYPPPLFLFLFTGKSRICLPDYFYSRDIFEDYSIWIIATS